NTANILIAIALLIGTPFFVIFGALSDKIGRKPIIMAGCLIAAATSNTANILIAIALLIGTPFFVIFGALSDKIGRKP
ncbi:hypothetical protein CTI14_69015, partial [Methylobacterium radiotolerans]